LVTLLKEKRNKEGSAGGQHSFEPGEIVGNLYHRSLRAAAEIKPPTQPPPLLPAGGGCCTQEMYICVEVKRIKG
jgi:hypothetical protein